MRHLHGRARAADPFLIFIPSIWIVYMLSMTLNSMLRLISFFSFSEIKEVALRLKEQENDQLIVQVNVSCTKMLSFYLLHASVSVNIIIDVIL
jgi:hypothetical protein